MVLFNATIKTKKESGCNPDSFTLPEQTLLILNYFTVNAEHDDS